MARKQVNEIICSKTLKAERLSCVALRFESPTFVHLSPLFSVLFYNGKEQWSDEHMSSKFRGDDGMF